MSDVLPSAAVLDLKAHQRAIYNERYSLRQLALLLSRPNNHVLAAERPIMCRKVMSLSTEQRAYFLSLLHHAKPAPISNDDSINRSTRHCRVLANQYAHTRLVYGDRRYRVKTLLRWFCDDTCKSATPPWHRYAYAKTVCPTVGCINPQHCKIE